VADGEKLELTMQKVERTTKDGDVVQDLKTGYVYFNVMLEGNGKKILLDKKIRLDKPERMLNKFVTKIKGLAEEQYKEQKYHVADKKPRAIETVLVNEDDVNDKMMVVFEEVGQYVKTSNVAVLGTSVVEF
jgi:hypothetical protein